MISFLVALASSERSFKIVGNDFQMDGKPFHYVSGSFHYFRQQPDQWEETIKKMANGGLNAVQTYVAWNLHEPEQGQWNFEGIADLDRFISLCEKYNMYVILRPGPFICAEWDFGGFPYWLTNIEGIDLRSSDEKYLKPVDAYLKKIYSIVKPHMYHNGGNIILVQIENEYGFFPKCDKEYLKHLAIMTREELGQETVLFTTDTYTDGALSCGTIPELAFATVDFGTGLNPEGAFNLQRSYNGGTGPFVNSEFYPGWLDHWGGEHNKVDWSKVTYTLEEMLKLGANVNFYMYFGGTNFKFYNGANGGGWSVYEPDPTNYDYDAPLNEMGDMTYKWLKVRETIAKYATWEIPSHKVSNTTRKNYGPVKFTEGISLFDALHYLSRTVHNKDIMYMEQLGGDFGYTLYHTKISEAGNIYAGNIRDRMVVFVNKKQVDIVQRGQEHNIRVEAGDLDILVECLGRLNFGGDFFERHGLPEGVTLEGKRLENWDMTTFNLENIHNLKFSSNLPTKLPSFYRGTFVVDEVADTFLNPAGYNKGVAFINGYNIGRFWYPQAPQLSLYVPQSLLKKGVNELIIFECDGVDEVKDMILDGIQNVDYKPW